MTENMRSGVTSKNAFGKEGNTRILRWQWEVKLFQVDASNLESWGKKSFRFRKFHVNLRVLSCRKFVKIRCYRNVLLDEFRLHSTVVDTFPKWGNPLCSIVEKMDVVDHKENTFLYYHLKSTVRFSYKRTANVHCELYWNFATNPKRNRFVIGNKAMSFVAYSDSRFMAIVAYWVCCHLSLIGLVTLSRLLPYSMPLSLMRFLGLSLIGFVADAVHCELSLNAKSILAEYSMTSRLLTINLLTDCRKIQWQIITWRFPQAKNKNKYENATY